MWIGDAKLLEEGRMIQQKYLVLTWPLLKLDLYNLTNTRMDFINNHAFNGGGLTLLGSARIIINRNTLLLFDSNGMGGAIFNKLIITERNTYEFITNCFVE